MVLFSVITVCLNAEQSIRETIQSVLNQTSTNFEYIIKDGLSSDKTVSIAQSFSDAFAERGIPYRIISQEDSGIYDAMNQAIQEARGEWINFMNAGDAFADKTILNRVAESSCIEKADVVYGDRIQRRGELYYYQKARELEKMRYVFPFGHQSTFTRRKLFENTLYSTQYCINSDYKFYLQMYHDGKVFCYFPAAVSIYDTSGISSHWELTLPEVIKVLEEMPVRDEEAIQIKKQELEVRKKQEKHMLRRIWKCVPQKLREKRWKLKLKNAGWKTEEEFFGKKKDNP